MLNVYVSSIVKYDMPVTYALINNAMLHSPTVP